MLQADLQKQIYRFGLQEVWRINACLHIFFLPKTYQMENQKWQKDKRKYKENIISPAPKEQAPLKNTFQI